MNQHREVAISLLENFIEDPFRFALLWYTCDGLRLSYSIWAAEEMLNLLEIQTDIPPLVTIENFRDRVKEYMFLNTKTAYIFSVAYDTANYFVDLLTN